MPNRLAEALPRRFVLPALLAILVLASLAASFLVPHGFAATVINVTARLRALREIGWLIFIAAQAAIALVGILPASLLGIAAGAVYGISLGFITSGIGVMAGALIAFALSRSAFRPLIAVFLGRRARLAALDNLVTQDRWRIVALLRVSPVMPFSLTSYALGLSGIAPRDYFIGTLASLPGLLGYVVIGALGGSTIAAKSGNDRLIHITLLALGAAATLALTIHLSRLLTRALRAPDHLDAASRTR
jgi:uncharacterized membrane protein YdjX (TVP38/TMEM64 family)